ncbi:histone-lysine N-methyltransferase, H3 lysine-36 specific [Caerostris darwini]|uniref:Histone-lysine N-methyltransferase, H3 lysine-36 specific n=1 Tax=Caerostris darwini TaxID=1538125 RepID=A0AAV4NZW3_9ARAC|nr:histone-lysine N-methyltransferase, H3 lysine-36 specific [Caerostris darwini]
MGKRKIDEVLEEPNFRTKCSKFNKENVVNGFNGDVEMSEVEENSNSSLSRESNSNNKFLRTKLICFSCKSKVGDLIKCSVESCDKYYHKTCFEKLPYSKSEINTCLLHVCLSCYIINPKNSHSTKGEMYKCNKCPTAFHTKEECYVPGAVLLSNNIMTCPNHFSPEKVRGYPGVMNLCFCVQCGCNDDLLFCNSCPCAIHEKCLKAGTYKGDVFICDRCKSKKTVSFNDVVWAKVYNLRWWPAKVMNPENIPVNVKKIKHFDGEFPVQFFGTDECYWTQNGRVYPFISKRVGLEDKNLKHNFKKVISDPRFDNAVKLALKSLSDQREMNAIENGNPKKPPPYKHVKTNRPVGNVQLRTSHDTSDYNPCGCKSGDKDPCGYDSLCLNRSMCTECYADVCEAGDRCQNQKFQKLEYAKVKPFWTSTKSWGLKALEDIKEGHFVIEYLGDLIDEEECERRIKQKQEVGDTNFYFCTLDATRIIDAGPKGNFSRFMNHSCEPNCETQKWSVNGDGRIGIFAKKDIPAGSELTFDYQMDFAHYEKLKCYCGSKRCSGLIGKKPQNGIVQYAEEEISEPSTSSPDSKSTKKKNTKKVNGIIEKNTHKSLKISSINGLSPKEESAFKQNGFKKDRLICFKCKTGGRFLQCTLEECKKYFHVRCVRPGIETVHSSDWECPRHYCVKCKRLSSYQCFLCPNSYCVKHVVKVPRSGKFACPKHSKECLAHD